LGPSAHEVAGVEPVGVVADDEVRAVEHVPHGAHESVVPANLPLRRKLDIGLVVPLPCGTDRAGPLDHVVRVNPAPGNVLERVKVPHVALDSEPAMPGADTARNAL